MNTELAHELIRIIGEKKIVQVYKLLGSVQVSFAMLFKELYRHQVFIKLKSGEFISVADFAKQYGKSKSTIYRALKKLRKK